MRDLFLTDPDEVNDEEDFKETLRFACRQWSLDQILFNFAVLFLGFSATDLQCSCL